MGRLTFVTTNSGKVREASEYLSGVVNELDQFEYDYSEIQHNDLGVIASHGCEEAFEARGGDAPVIVEDSGLFIDVLDGFPGPYSSYVYGSLGLDRVWGIVREEENRRAAFRSVVAYYDGDELATFEGVVRGNIVGPRGSGGFGYDPIFEYNGRTMAEMSLEEKNAVSHRGRALAKLASWLAGESATSKGTK